MARKLDERVIKARIKENTAKMKAAKKDISSYMATATKGFMNMEPSAARKQFSAFVKSAEAVKADIAKLDLLARNQA